MFRPTPQAVLFQLGRYQLVADTLEVKEVDLPDTEDRYIGCQNSKAVEANRRERKEIVESLVGKLSSGSTKRLLRSAARRYVRVQGREAVARLAQDR